MKKHKDPIQNFSWGQQKHQFQANRIEIITKSATKDVAMAGWNPKRTSSYMVTATMGSVGTSIVIDQHE